MQDHGDERLEERLSTDSFVNSIIGEGTRFRGEFDLDGLLRIDGDFSGVVRTRGNVLIGRNGRAECTVYAGTVVVGGAIRGDIHATEKVVILSTGIMIGNVHAPRLIMEEGVLFSGDCHIGEDVAQVPVPSRSVELIAGNGNPAMHASSFRPERR